MDFPERLRRQEGDEEQEEAVRPFGLGRGARNFANMSTNILGLLSVANPKVDLHNRFAGYSSEEDANDSGDETIHDKKDGDASMAQTTVLTQPGSKRRKRSTGHRLMQSVPILSRLSSKKSVKEGKQPEANIREESEAEVDSSSDENADENSLAPHMSRILEARAEVESRPSFELERHATNQGQNIVNQTGSSPTDLAKRLQEIFGFDEPESVISGQIPMSILSLWASTDMSHRISMLPAPSCPSPGVYLHHGQPLLLLCILAQKGSQFPRSPRCQLGRRVTYCLPARNHQIRLSVESGQAKSQVQQIYVPAEGRRPFVL